MTVTINGTSGVTAPEVTLDNSAADGGQVVLKSSGYSNWNWDNYSGRLRAYYASTEYFTIDSSGNVGIGTNSPSYKLDWYTTNSIAGRWANSTRGGYFYTDSGGPGIFNTNNYAGEGMYMHAGSNYIRWLTASSERMTLDSGGNLLINGNAQQGSEKLAVSFDGTVANGMSIKDTSTQSGSYYIFFRNSSNGMIGWINKNGSTNAVVYSTTSDYRLKENIQPMTGALEKVAQLNPVTYTWKADGSDGQGFIAHELQAVIPDCVSGEKDAVNEDGSILPQGIDTSFLVATLTKAIQEQQAQIETLTAKVAALEAK